MTAYSIDVEITAPVMETEDPDLVAAAITSLFPAATPERRPGELTATVHDLEHLSRRLHQQEILDTARSTFHEGRREDAFSFALKKQAALQGVVNFAVGEPDELGEITVRVAVADPGVEAVVDRVAPPTEDGRPVPPD